MAQYFIVSSLQRFGGYWTGHCEDGQLWWTHVHFANATSGACFDRTLQKSQPSIPFWSPQQQRLLLYKKLPKRIKLSVIGISVRHQKGCKYFVLSSDRPRAEEFLVRSNRQGDLRRSSRRSCGFSPPPEYFLRVLSTWISRFVITKFFSMLLES